MTGSRSSAGVWRDAIASSIREQMATVASWRDLGEDELARRPSPERWGLADIADHLAAATREYRIPIVEGIEEARAAGLHGDHAPRLRFFERWFVGYLEPPPRWKSRAPSQFRPPEVPAPENALGRYRAEHEALLAALDSTEGLDLDRAKMRNPVVPLLTFRLGAAFAILEAHGRRHLWQADAVLAAFD